MSTYIGRPLALDERDYDTPLPQDDLSDSDAWSAPGPKPTSKNDLVPYAPVAASPIATFRERAQLGTSSSIRKKKADKPNKTGSSSYDS